MALQCTYVPLPQEETEDGGDNCHIKTPENLALVSKLLKVSGWGATGPVVCVGGWVL